MKHLEWFGTTLMYAGLIAFLAVGYATTSDKYFGTAYRQSDSQIGRTK